MHVLLASDHGGYDLKEHLKVFLAAKGYVVRDYGTSSKDSVDYPGYAKRVAADVAKDEEAVGILVCGTGIGMSMVANRFTGIRAALCHDEFTAQMSREHNHANILCLGGRLLSQRQGELICRKWLETEFEGGRHQRRLDAFPEGCAASEVAL